MITANTPINKMEVMGIKFAPLHIPFQRRLQTLAAGSWFYIMALGGFTGLLTAMYLVLFTNYWLGTLFYLIWAWTLDTDTCERGGRRIQWVQKLRWWKYMKDYFPLHLKKAEDFELDPKRNYLFCSFPHGMLSTGAFSAFCTDASDFKKLFPDHTSHLLTLKQHFSMPYFRELIYSLGLCSSSAESINWLLKYPGGGKAPLLIVGGTAEAFHCKPGQYRLVLKNRKGFVKLAMKNGCALVPVFSFGETDLFDQLENKWLRRFQQWIKSMAGIAPLIPVGRGFIQYSFGWVPQRKPVTTVVGKPLEVDHVESPTTEEVDAIHDKFVNRLTELFEEHKHKYLENAENVKLIIE